MSIQQEAEQAFAKLFEICERLKDENTTILPYAIEHLGRAQATLDAILCNEKFGEYGTA